MLTTPLMMAVPLAGAAVSRVDGVKWSTILLVSRPSTQLLWLRLDAAAATATLQTA